MAAQAFVGCGLVDLLCGDTTLVTGLQDEPDGSLRVYVGARYDGVYAVIEPDAQAEQAALRSAWRMGGHVVIVKPPADCLHGGDRP